jgi:glycosyltransferase involved in cell wall biosynthesis
VNITVILCTYNRCHTLEKALHSVAASELPGEVEWEVVVVDNNSGDETPEVVKAFRNRYPSRFRYLLEREQGKSYALNTGVREARGEILAFMDDDVIVEPTWLRNLTRALQNPEWAGAGGRIVLEWPPSLPNWLVVDGPLARHGFPGFDKGTEAKQLLGPPFGTNMAFRKSMFVTHGGFRTDLGPSPNREIPRPSEDTEFGRRLIAAGERLWYEPSAVVFHPVPADRISKEDFLRWGFDLGRANIRTLGIHPGSKWFAGKIPLYLIRRLLVWIVRWTVSLSPSRRFSYKVTVWEKAGEIAECYRRVPASDRLRVEHSIDRHNEARSL